MWQPHCLSQGDRHERKQKKEMSTSHLHIVRPPCPRCFSPRTIRTAKDNLKETLDCQDCNHTWNVDMPRTAAELLAVKPARFDPAKRKTFARAVSKNARYRT